MRSAIWHALKVKPYGHRVSADLLTSGTHAIVMPQGRHAGGRRRSRGAKASRGESDDPLRMMA